MFIAQILGFVGFVLMVCSFQQNHHKKIVLFQCVATAVFSVHFIMLGAIMGAVLNAINVIRTLLLFNTDSKWKNSLLFPILFSTVYALSGMFFFETAIDIFPVIAVIINTVALWIKNPKIVRIVSLPASPFWFTYNLSTGSLAGVLTESFILVSIITAMFRFDFKKKHVKNV